MKHGITWSSIATIILLVVAILIIWGIRVGNKAIPAAVKLSSVDVKCQVKLCGQLECLGNL